MHSFLRVGRIAPLVAAGLAASIVACSDTSSPNVATIDSAGGARFALSTPPAGLVAAYGFEEASGSTVADASGNNNNGSFGAGVARTTSGKFGSALAFNGSYVTVPDAPSLDLTTGMTLEAWVLPTAAPSGWATAVLKEQTGRYVYALYNSAPNAPSGEINVSTSQSGERIAKASSQTPLNTWTHLAATYDGSTVRVYVNGALAGSTTASAPITTSGGDLRIGGNAVWGELFTGRIDEVRIYNRPLSASEINTDMTTPVGGGQTLDTTAPTIAITAPTAASTYATSATQVTLSGTANDNIGVTQVTWTNSRGGSGTATGTTSWSTAGIPLQIGTNVITVTARDAANNTGTATVTVTLSGSDASLVAAYGFNETSGNTTLDRSGNNNEGTFVGGVTRTTSGRFGSALVFSANYVSVPDAASLDLTSAMTLEAWVYPTSSPSGWTTAVLKEQTGAYAYALYNSAPSTPSGEINVGTASSGERIAAAPSAAPLNTWTHLASTYDGSTVRLYVNGALVASKAATGPIMASNGALQIGGNGIWGEFFFGRIDEVRIYNRALTAAQVQTDMTTPIDASATSDANPPAVSITSPTTASSYTATSPQITVAGVASDNVGVMQVMWSNDRGGSGMASGTTNWSASGIPLQTGTNVIRVTAMDASNNSAAATLTVTLSTTPSMHLTITTQPSSSAASGAVFAQQPVIQVRDASNNAVAQSGVVVTAAIASGGGTLNGTASVATNANGVAAFTNLSITGTAGTRTLSFAAPSMTGVTSNGISISATSTPPGSDEPVFNASTNTMVYQDNMDSYVDVVSMGALSPSTPRIVPRPSPVTTSQPVDTRGMQLTSGRSGKAIRMFYDGSVQNGPTFLTWNMPSTPDLATHYFSYYARVTPSSPFTNHLAHKWFLAYHRHADASRAEWDTHDHLPCTVDHHDTYWHFYDGGKETVCQGQQPIGPYFNEDISDGQWHRFTYAYRPNTSPGSRDGFARMWIDGVKMMDISASAVGVTPPGGEKPWCNWDDVDAILVNDGIVNQFWGSVQTSYTSPTWTLDVDDYSWWIKR